MPPKRRNCRIVVDSPTTSEESDNFQSLDLHTLQNIDSFLEPRDLLLQRSLSGYHRRATEERYDDCDGVVNVINTRCTVYVLEKEDSGRAVQRFESIWGNSKWSRVDYPPRCYELRSDVCARGPAFMYQAHLASYVDYHCRMEARPNDGRWKHLVSVRDERENLHQLLSVASNWHSIELKSYGKSRDVPSDFPQAAGHTFLTSNVLVTRDGDDVTVLLHAEYKSTPLEQIIAILDKSDKFYRFVQNVHDRLIRRAIVPAEIQSSVECTVAPEHVPHGWALDGRTLARSRTECQIYFA